MSSANHLRVQWNKSVDIVYEKARKQMAIINEEKPIDRSGVCDRCSKTMDLDKPNHGLKFNVSLTGMEQEDIDYVKHDFGKFRADRNYKICMECVLTVMGVNPSEVVKI